MKQISSLILCLLTLTACGFNPLYGGTNKANNNINSKEYLSLTQIGNLPDREGQFLRNALIGRFYPHGHTTNTKYLLNIEPIHERLIDLDITKTAASTRGQLQLDTNITLTERATNTILMTRKIRSITSYNILASEFSSRISEQAARQNALNDLALQTETQLNLYFKRQNP